MKRQLILTAAVLAVAGCGADKSATATNKQPLRVADARTTPGGGAIAADGGSSPMLSNTAPPAPGMVVPPEGANWTIWVRPFSGPGHVEQAKMIKDQLVKSTGMGDWYVIHSESDSILYYGFYRAVDDMKHEPADTRRAKADHVKLGTIKDVNGQAVFKSALFVNVNSPDPDAPPEWDLYRVDGAKGDDDPSKAFWSVVIASYSGAADRKRLAVESVREARKQGIPAYYHHGETVSDVYVGTWPRTAVREQIASEGRTTTEDDRVMVSNIALPDSMTQNVRDREGKPVAVLQPKLEIQDPSMLATLRKYPVFSLNGEEDNRVEKDRSGRSVVRAMPSAVVQIPRDQANKALITTQMPEDPATTGLLAPINRGSQGGRLRSVGP